MRPGNPSGRAILDARDYCISMTVRTSRRSFLRAKALSGESGLFFAAPMLREGAPIGVIIYRRTRSSSFL